MLEILIFLFKIIIGALGFYLALAAVIIAIPFIAINSNFVKNDN